MISYISGDGLGDGMELSYTETLHQTEEISIQQNASLRHRKARGSSMSKYCCFLEPKVLSGERQEQMRSGS